MDSGTLSSCECSDAADDDYDDDGDDGDAMRVCDELVSQLPSLSGKSP